VDPTQQTASAVDELRQIRLDARKTRSVDGLRRQFDRLQNIRRQYVDDFDVQVIAAEAHEEIIERARTLRGAIHTDDDAFPEEESGAAEIPPEVPRLDLKSWQRAVGLALFFTVLVLAAFFYLIQSARKLNFQEQQAAAGKAASTATVDKPTTASMPPPPVSLTPTLRLYTDLIPGTVVLDDQPPRNLTDGELILDHLRDGTHSVKLAGRSGTAAFQFTVKGNAAPQPSGMPSASNALVVLVSDRDGHGYLATNAERATIALDGKAAGEASAQGLTLEALGTADREFEVSRGRDRQRFVWTYTRAPALTVYVKSDPNTGTLVLMTGQDGVEVYIDNGLYRRKTDRGPLRIPLKVGSYKIRVHKAGFVDPAPLPVEVKKSEETPLQFKLESAPAVTNPILAAPPPPPPAPTPETVQSAEPKTPAADTPAPAPATAVDEPAPPQGSQVRRGGGFVSYGTPKTAGSYSFQALGRVGGFLKKSRLQWYAGYQDGENYILFSLDGKHASVREVRRGKSIEWNRIPFSADSNKWIAVSLTIKPDSVSARVKGDEGSWSDLGSVSSPGRDFTQDKVGVYIPAGDEMAVSNFRFAQH
jgi:PEGA domain-containing protein